MPVEPIAPELRASVRVGGGVCIRKIRKIYRTSRSGHEINALDNLTLTMFPGQVCGVELCE